MYSKHLLTTYYVAGTVLEAEDTIMTRVDSLYSPAVSILWGREGQTTTEQCDFRT